MKTTTPNTGNWFVDKLSLYQSANSDNTSIKNNFVIRQAEFEIIVSDLKNKSDKDPLQHELILGRRGSGKSTLLRRIQAEMEENSQLQKKYIAINLAEEQAGIYRLFDLWDEVLKELAIKFNTQIQLKSYSEFNDDQVYTRYLYQAIHDLLIQHKRKVVLLLDNFDRIVGNFNDDGNLLRETLLNHNDIQIIAGSTRMDEHFWQYDKPFYEFFRRHRLESLSIEEIIQLLNHWSKVMELPQLADFAKKNIGKLEAIRILTDGLPRTLQFFIQLLLQNANLYGYEYLRKVMDSVTTLYQERLNSLPAAQRKIIAEMAFIWEAASTKDLVEKCRMQSKLISAQIKQLSNVGIIDTITTDNKNHLYRIAERFFNMWLIITQGNPEQKRKAKWLSIFLETWYDAAELKQLAINHISNLENKKMSYDKALVFTKAFSQSKYVTTSQRDKILELTTALQPKGLKDILLELPKKYSDIVKEIEEKLAEKNYQKANQLANEIENEEDGLKFSIQAFILDEQNNCIEAEKYYLLAIEKGDTNALFNLANLYDDQEKYTEAEKYYLLAIEKGITNALYNLAILYKNQQKYADAEKYYLLGIRNGIVEAYNNLAVLYEDQQNYAEAEKQYLLAIEKGDKKALFNLAVFYEDQQKYAEAEKYYLLAIKKENVKALHNLANLYDNQQKYPEAEKLYLLAIEKENVDSLFNLAIFYNNRQKYTEAEKYYLLAIEKGDIESLNNLANFYVDQLKYPEAEKYYLLAIKKGNIDALFNLAMLYRNQLKDGEAEKYYLIAIEKGNVNALNNLAILYDDQQKYGKAEKYYLLAIEKGIANALYNLATLYYKKNIKKSIALNLILKYNSLVKNDKDAMETQITIEVWNGIFENIIKKTEQLFISTGHDELEWFFTNLLSHEQQTLVLNLFTDKIHGEEFQKRYAPLYYAVLILNNKTENNLTLRIPPEILPTVNDIIETVKEKQRFYAS